MPTELAGLRNEIEANAAEVDAASTATHDALAGQLGAVTPSAARPILAALPALLTAMGGALEGEPTSLGDPAVSRGLAAVADASEDAAAADVIPEELVFSVGDITDDASARVVGGKLGMLQKSKPFLKWLKTPVEQAGEKPPAVRAPPDSSAADEALLMSRVGGQ